MAHRRSSPPRQTEDMSPTVPPSSVLAYRAQASGLDAKLPAGSFAAAAWGGLQDSVPRGGIISLHARVEDVQPDSWEDPSLAQIWFRGGADYIVPRADVGIFTLGSYPRDPEAAAALERLADEIDRVTDGETLKVAEVSARLGPIKQPTEIRAVALTGRALIRWDASNIWLIPVKRQDIDAEDARLELARRFLHWLGPATKADLARWTGVTPRDATATWKALEPEMATVEISGKPRAILAADLDVLQRAEPVSGVRLLPMDDPFTKLDHDLLVPDVALRGRALPIVGKSPGYIPGAVVVDGTVVGGWQRQQRKVTIHSFPAARLSARVREAIEREALAFPIAGASSPSVSWG
jgi:hypothetical protein